MPVRVTASTGSTLAPKRADTDFVEFRLGFAGGELRAMELKDKLQQTTRIEFFERRAQHAPGG